MGFVEGPMAAEFTSMQRGYNPLGMALNATLPDVKAEYGIFKAYVKHLVLLLLEHTEGNPPGQGLGDCATLKNRWAKLERAPRA
jgi:hypothetical protein